MSVALCQCEKRSLTLNEEHMLRVLFTSKMLRKISGRNWEEVVNCRL